MNECIKIINPGDTVRHPVTGIVGKVVDQAFPLRLSPQHTYVKALGRDELYHAPTKQWEKVSE